MPTNKAIRVIYFFKFVHFIRFKVTELFVFEIYTFLKIFHPLAPSRRIQMKYIK